MLHFSGSECRVIDYRWRLNKPIGKACLNPWDGFQVMACTSRSGNDGSSASPELIATAQATPTMLGVISATHKTPLKRDNRARTTDRRLFVKDNCLPGKNRAALETDRQLFDTDRRRCTTDRVVLVTDKRVFATDSRHLARDRRLFATDRAHSAMKQAVGTSSNTHYLL